MSAVVKLYTSSSTVYEYTDIWDMDIGGQSISGATYFEQEARTATWTMPHNAVLGAYIQYTPPAWSPPPESDNSAYDGYANPVGKWHMHKALVEIWERFTYADQNSEIRNHERILFRGYLFRDSFAVQTVGKYSNTSGTQTAKIVTITAYDYLAVLANRLQNKELVFEIENPDPDDPDNDNGGPTTTQLIWRDQIQALWELVPYGATANDMLWVRPSLDFDVEDQPYYPTLQLFPIHKLDPGTQAADRYDYYDARVYQNETNGPVYYEELRLRWFGWIAFEPKVYHYVWTRYRIIGSNLVQYGAPVDESGSGLGPTPWDPDAAGDWVVQGGYNPAQWQNQKQCSAIVGGVPLAYSIRQEADEPPAEGEPWSWGGLWWPWDDYQGLESGNNSLDMDKEIWLTVSGAVPLDKFVLAEEMTINAKTWLSWLLNTRFAWLRPSASLNGYTVCGKNISSSAASTDLSGCKVTEFYVETEIVLDSYNESIPEIWGSDAILEGMRNYLANQYYKNNKIVSFKCNQLISVGDYITLPDYHDAPILITEHYYNPAQPFLYSYKGRSL